MASQTTSDWKVMMALALPILHGTVLDVSTQLKPSISIGQTHVLNGTSNVSTGKPLHSAGFPDWHSLR